MLGHPVGRMEKTGLIGVVDQMKAIHSVEKPVEKRFWSYERECQCSEGDRYKDETLFHGFVVEICETRV